MLYGLIYTEPYVLDVYRDDFQVLEFQILFVEQLSLCALPNIRF